MRARAAASAFAAEFVGLEVVRGCRPPSETCSGAVAHIIHVQRVLCKGETIVFVRIKGGHLWQVAVRTSQPWCAVTPLATVAALPRPEGDIVGLAALEAVRGVPGGWDSALDGEDIAVFAELVGRARTAARGSV